MDLISLPLLNNVEPDPFRFAYSQSTFQLPPRSGAFNICGLCITDGQNSGTTVSFYCRYFRKIFVSFPEEARRGSFACNSCPSVVYIGFLYSDCLFAKTLLKNTAWKASFKFICVIDGWCQQSCRCRTSSGWQFTSSQDSISSQLPVSV